MIRIDEYSFFVAYQNRHKHRKIELIQLLEYLMRSKITPLVEENNILREQLDVKNGMIDALIIENEKLKKLIKECERYIDCWGYYDSTGNLLFPQIEAVLGEKK